MVNDLQSPTGRRIMKIVGGTGLIGSTTVAIASGRPRGHRRLAKGRFEYVHRGTLRPSSEPRRTSANPQLETRSGQTATGQDRPFRVAPCLVVRRIQRCASREGLSRRPWTGSSSASSTAAWTISAIPTRSRSAGARLAQLPRKRREMLGRRWRGNTGITGTRGR